MKVNEIVVLATISCGGCLFTGLYPPFWV
jgi:carbonic anhydrase